jgi:cytochrome c biogenesis protein CcmG, thiol:disulfide interchange protein DsbE
MSDGSTPSGGGPRAPDRRRVVRAVWGVAALAIATRARANDLRVGSPAPPLVLHALDGRRYATRELLGDVVIANFWATWCVPCRVELPQLSMYAEQRGARGLQVLGFSLDGPDDLPAVREVAKQLTFPVGLLGSAWAGGYGRIWRLPVSFVIDRAGRLAHDGWGDDPEVPWTEARLAKLVDPLL